jgi:hypothetical protein
MDCRRPTRKGGRVSDLNQKNDMTHDTPSPSASLVLPLGREPASWPDSGHPCGIQRRAAGQDAFGTGLAKPAPIGPDPGRVVAQRADRQTDDHARRYDRDHGRAASMVPQQPRIRRAGGRLGRKIWHSISLLASLFPLQIHRLAATSRNVVVLLTDDQGTLASPP